MMESSALKLLDLTLKPAGAIVTSQMGEFTAPSRQEIAILRAGGCVELYSIETITPESNSDDDDDEEEEESKVSLKLITRMETRSVLRSMCVVRLSGGKRDVLSVGADGGCASVLDFEGGRGRVLYCPAFGKTGCRRGTPGQYVVSDPKGRAIMIAAIEKRKLVYVLNRDSSGKPTIASPLEAHRSRTITFALCGVDNGYDNPIFAALETQYADPESEGNGDESDGKKELAYYELDLGLNHVSRRWASRAVHKSACCLGAVPGGGDGPGGVLVCGEDWVEYMHEGMSSSSSSGKIIAPIPRRKLHPVDKGVLITTITVHRQKRGKFFALCQSEFGDVYKVTLELNDSRDEVLGMTICLLDTLPVANALNVTKLGMLFVAAEFSDHALYEFERIDLEDVTVTTTSMQVQEAFTAAIAPVMDEDEKENFHVGFYDTLQASKIAGTFVPTKLQNLKRVDGIQSLAPATGVLVGELAGGEVSPQIYTLCGRGPRSSLRIMRHGAAVTELAVSDLPGTPGAVFTIQSTGSAAESSDNTNTENTGSSSSQSFDKYIIVSFADATLVLSIGETVEEVTEGSGFIHNAPTLACSALGNDGGICQVHPGGVRHIQGTHAKQWHCPGLKRIEMASANSNQILIALAGGEIIYFELDPMSGNLNEAGQKDMGSEISCLDVGEVAKGSTRSLFAAVGCRDKTCRVLSLMTGSLLTQRSSTALKTLPHSVCLQQMKTESGGTSSSDATSAVSGTMQDDTFLTVGLEDGSAMRASLDPTSGAISDSPTRRFLGARPVSVLRTMVDNQSCTLLLSSRPWISRFDPTTGKYATAPLSYAPLDHACQFRSELIREGIVATAGTTLRILSVEQHADEAFNATSVNLRYTPRQMCLLSGQLAICEADHNDHSQEEKKNMGFDSSGSLKKTKKGDDADDDMAMDVDSDEEAEKKDDDKNVDEDEEDEEEESDKTARLTPIRGPMPSSPGHWGSCIRLLSPSTATTLDTIEMDKNEAALCCCSVQFHSRGGEALLAVGTVTNFTMHPSKHSAAHIVLYRMVNGDRLQLLHRTKVEAPVLALAHFQGRLLAGVGRTLRLYEMGKRQVLKKCELRGIPNMVKTLQAAGDRAYLGDMLHSMHFVRYDTAQNRLVLMANDRTSRCVTCQELLDIHTVAVGDKFGNIVILRLPKGADGGSVDISGTRALWESSQDTTPKLEMLCQYYVGEVVTGMTRASLVAGGSEALIYVTITGRIGAMLPFQSREDTDFYQQLEMNLRTDAPRPTGRDPIAYRSYYGPVKYVTDGDLCESYAKLSAEVQKKVADKLDRTVGEVMKKLEDTRNGLL